MARKKLEDAFKKATEEPAFSEGIERFGLAPGYMSGADYEKFVAENFVKMGKVIKHLGLVEKK